MAEAKELGAPYELVRLVAAEGKLPVPNFAAGGIATPADAALMMQLGAEAVFVGSGIFKSERPAERARAIVRATTHYADPAIVAEVSRGLGEAMRGHRDVEAGRVRAAADAGLVMRSNRRPGAAGRLRGPRGGAARIWALRVVEVRQHRRARRRSTGWSFPAARARRCST